MKIFTKPTSLLLTTALIFVMHLSASAQKDLKVEMLTPTAGQNIIKNEPFEIKCNVKNNGTVDVAPGDTLAVGVQVGGQYVYVAFVQHTGIAAGVTKEVKFDLSLSFSSDFSNIDLCTGFLLYTNTDPTPADQFSCKKVNLFLTAPTTGVANEVSAPINVFPNPANSYINIERAHSTSETLSVYDLQGKLIETAELTSEMQRIALDNYTNGIYLYVLKDISGQIVSRGKFNVVH